MTRRISDNNFWNCRLGQISHFILSHYILEGSGISWGGGGRHENNACCFLLRIAKLLIFIHNGGIGKVTMYGPDLKMVHILFVTKVFQEDTMFKNSTLNSVQLSGAGPCPPLHQSLCEELTLGFF